MSFAFNLGNLIFNHSSHQLELRLFNLDDLWSPLRNDTLLFTLLLANYNVYLHHSNFYATYDWSVGGSKFSIFALFTLFLSFSFKKNCLFYVL